MPKISCIVPVYKVEEALNYCIKSILHQTFTDFELILVDDGSPDNSWKICDEYAEKDTRVKVIHKQNGGVSSARNTGIEAAQGEYICFVDSDDYLESNYLEVLIETKRNHSDFDNVWCGFQTVEDYLKNNKKSVVSENNNDYSFSDLSSIMDLCEKWLVQMPWNKLFETKTIKKNNIIFPPGLSLGEDYIFNLKYLDCTNGKIVVINKPLYNYLRDGKESLDNKYYSNLLEIYRRLNSEIEQYSEKWNLSDAQISKMYSASFFRLEAVLRNTFNKKNNQSFIKKIKYNNEILKSNDFQESMKKMDTFIHPIYRFAYKKRKYLLVMCLDFLSAYKIHLFKNGKIWVNI